MIKKTFIKPEIELIEITCDEIITSSGTTEHTYPGGSIPGDQDFE